MARGNLSNSSRRNKINNLLIRIYTHLVNFIHDIERFALASDAQMPLGFVLLGRRSEDGIQRDRHIAGTGHPLGMRS